MFSLLSSLLSSSKFWLVAVLVATNAFSWFKGDGNGYARGYDVGHAEAVAINGAFTLFREQAVEAAMAEQVRRNDKEEQLKTSNQKVTEDYVQLASIAGSAMRSLDADRVRAVAALAGREAAGGSAVPIDPATGLHADAPPEDRTLAECFREYEAVVGESKDNANQVTVLQKFITGVLEK